VVRWFAARLGLSLCVCVCAWVLLPLFFASATVCLDQFAWVVADMVVALIFNYGHVSLCT
jgi:hypothetical protein